MIINPSVFLGWNGVFKGDVNHLALSAPAVRAGGEASVDIRLALSADGVQWSPQPVAGDLRQYSRSNGGPGAFEIMGLLRFKGKWWAHGAIWKSANENEGALFCSLDGREFNRVLTGFEGTSALPAYRHYRFADAGSSELVMLRELGEVLYSQDGSAWSQRTDVIGYSTAFGPAIAGRGLAVTSSGVVIIGETASGSGAKVKTANSAGASFTDRGAPWGIKGVNLVARGNLVIGFSIYNPSLGSIRAAYANANNIATTWANAGLEEAIGIDRGFFALGRWYAGSATSGWRKSVGSSGVPGVGGWEAVTPPWSGGAALNSGYERDGRAFTHFGLGQLAVSDDGEDWDVVESSGLEPVRYLVAPA